MAKKAEYYRKGKTGTLKYLGETVSTKGDRSFVISHPTNGRKRSFESKKAASDAGYKKW